MASLLVSPTPADEQPEPDAAEAAATSDTKSVVSAVESEIAMTRIELGRTSVEMARTRAETAELRRLVSAMVVKVPDDSATGP